MANRESIGEALLRTQIGGAEGSAPWQKALRELVDEGTLSRPATRLVRVDECRRAFVYEGWRSLEIAACLDECALLDGGGWFGLVERFDKSGLRVVKAYAKPGDADRAFEQRHRARRNEASRQRVRVWRDGQKEEYEAYRRAYEAKFAGSGTEPVGFVRWLRDTRLVWLGQGVDGLVLNAGRSDFNFGARS